MKRLILFLLFLTWILLTTLYVRGGEFPFLSLNELSPFGRLNLVKTTKLQNGEKVIGEFVAKHPNFDTILVRFTGVRSADGDSLIFRLRDKDQKSWFYTARYEVPTNELNPDGYFAFGIPKIADSKNKNYEFEIESELKSPGAVVDVSTNYPVFIARSSFTTKEFVSDGRLLRYFLAEKFRSLIGDDEFLRNLLIFSLPLIFYIFFLIFGFGYYFPSLLVILAVIWDIFVFRGRYNFLWLAIMFAWFLPVIKFRIDSRVSVVFALIWLWLTFLFSLIGEDEWASKTQGWLYLFLLFFVFQGIYEFKKKDVISRVSVFNFLRGMIVSTYDSFRFIYLVVKRNYRAAAITLNYLLKLGAVFSQVTYQTATETLSHLNKSGAASLQMTERAAVMTLNYLPKLTSMSLQATERLLQKIGDWFRTILILIFRLIPFLLLWRVIIKLGGYLRAYQDFYPSLQEELFLRQTGIFLIILYLSAVVLFIFLSKKCRYVRMSIIAGIIVFSVIQIGDVIFDKTTEFGKVVIWKVRTSDTAEPWVDAFIDGRNLKNLPFVGRVFVNGVEQRIIRWSDREVIFRTDPYTTISGKIQVITSDGRKSNQLDFKYSGNR